MEISFGKPPIYDKAMELFKLPEGTIVFFTYGNTIFSPWKKMPSNDLIVHEQVHAEQQQHSDKVAKEWWERYFIDPEFRIDQEAEAYGEQFKFLKRVYKYRNRQNKILIQLAAFLSGDIYGKAITHSKAMKKIKAYAEGTVIKDIEKHIGEADET